MEFLWLLASVIASCGAYGYGRSAKVSSFSEDILMKELVAKRKRRILLENEERSVKRELDAQSK